MQKNTLTMSEPEIEPGSKLNVIFPNWPAPENVLAWSTLRSAPQGEAYSKKPFNDFNLAEHVEDDIAAVQANRALLKKSLQLPSEPCWLQQTHSTTIIEAKPGLRDVPADGSYTRQKNSVCIVMTADCLPVLLCDKQGTVVAAVHAGWRGLLDGILIRAVEKLNVPTNDIIAWIGPAIGPESFEVGDEVRTSFLKADQHNAQAFIAQTDSKWLANLYQLAIMQLNKLGISSISGMDRCTYQEQDQFFSYRRDGNTGRMATLICLS